MAKKEERIAVAKMLTGLDDDGSAQLDHFKIYTRAEAIEKIAKAMCHSPSGTCEDCFARESKKACKQAMFGMKELAEAALNALLEETK